MSAMTRKSALAATLMEKVWANTDRSEGCWLWTASARNGYGALAHEGKTHYVHRLVYQTLVEKVPDGLVLDHLCRNRACCNPSHLEPVTQRTNVLRGDTLARAHVEGRNCGHDGCRSCRRFAA